jgi:small ligand-binding sensory domain FIST
MRFATAASQHEEIATAVEELSNRLVHDLGGLPQVLWVFAGGPYGEQPNQLAEALRVHFPETKLQGCRGHSTIGAGREFEEAPALTAGGGVFPATQFRSFHIGPDDLPATGDRQAWCQRLDLPTDCAPQFVLLAHPLSPRLEEITSALDELFPGSVCIGGIASGGNDPAQSWILADGVPHNTGVSGLAIFGGTRIETLVAQGCRPVGTPSFVTRAEGNAILELDGKPPLDVLQETFSSADPREQQLLRSALFLGLAMREGSDQYRRGDFLVRNVMGVHQESGALVVGGEIREHSVAQFHVRDAVAAAEDLREQVQRLRDDALRPGGGLLFSCLGRGRGLYGVADHDIGVFGESFPQSQLAGFFCNGEIGPVEGRTYLHGYTSAFAVFIAQDA